MTLPTALTTIWADLGLPPAALEHLSLTGQDPVLPSSFAVGTAAQVSIGSAALAAATIGHHRNGLRQRVSVDMRHAALECCSRFSINGVAPELWDPIAGLYRCKTGWVRLHTNFAHHRDGVLRLLALPPGADTPRATVAQALSAWDALQFEEAATAAGMVVAAVRTFDEWDAHPHAAAIDGQDLISIERIGDAPPCRWPELPADQRPLSGLRVLDLTRILAGPFCGRSLAAYGADVMLINSPNLPNIDAIADTSRGKWSALADLRTPQGQDSVRSLLRDAEVFVQGYRPGALAALGFSAHEVARLRPGIVMVSLSAYGDCGPWAGKRGFDSLVQSATGFNLAEAQAAGKAQPQALPMQILDMATGALMALGAQAALLRQQEQGGSWHVRVSLARTGLWLRALGRVAKGFEAPGAHFDGVMDTGPSGWGELSAVRPAAVFSHTPAGFARPSMPPGSHPPAWPDH